MFSPSSLNDEYVSALIADKLRLARETAMYAELVAARRADAREDAVKASVLKRGARPAVGLVRRLLVALR